MAEIGVKIGNHLLVIGPPDLLIAWFSTISANLESNGWGGRYPTLLKKFYNGELASEDAETAIKELDQIKRHLSMAPPSQIIWAPHDFDKPAPEGTSVSFTAPNIAEAFLTPTGRNLFDWLRTAFEELRDRGGVARIVRIPTEFAVTLDGAMDPDASTG